MFTSKVLNLILLSKARFVKMKNDWCHDSHFKARLVKTALPSLLIPGYAIKRNNVIIVANQGTLQKIVLIHTRFHSKRSTLGMKGQFAEGIFLTTNVPNIDISPVTPTAKFYVQATWNSQSCLFLMIENSAITLITTATSIQVCCWWTFVV